jgi:uncharacterized protein YcbK (DUF882 family)
MDNINQSVLDSLKLETLRSLNSSPLSTVPQPVLNSTLTNVLAPIASKIVTDTNRTHTNTLNTPQRSILGTNNPYDLVNSNLSQTQLQNNLLTAYPSSAINSTAASYSAIIAGNLLSQLPQTFAQGIDKNSIQSTINRAMPGIISDSISKVTGNYVNGLYGSSLNYNSVVSDSVIASATLLSNPVDTLKAVGLNYAQGLINKYLGVSSLFNVNNNDNNDRLRSVRQGFIDPTSTYPEENYQGKSEVNLLAQGEPTVMIKDKETNRPVIPQAGGDTWQIPRSAFNAKYPYNKVTQTERGHIIEIDDTPGSERLHVYHRNGTYVEIDAFGTMVKRTVGSDYQIIDRNGFISIAGKASVSVGGSVNIYVGADAQIEVKGKTNITCHNDIEAKAGGRLKLSAAEAIDLRSKNIFIDADETLHLLGDSSLKLSSPTVSMNGSKSFTIGSPAFRAGPFSVGSASSSQAGLLDGRQGYQEVEVPETFPPSPRDSLALNVEEDATDDEIEDQKKKLIASGLVTEEDLNAPPVEGESSLPVSNNNTISEKSNNPNYRSLSDMPISFRLSPNFTLGMLSSMAAVSKDKVVAQSGLTYDSIIGNLELVAKNVCEPILSVYPNMYVSSGFRTQGGSIANSQHTKGEAVDIQFSNISKQEYFSIANILAQVLNYDVFLLEYTSYSNNPWIHISFKGDGTNRKQVATYYNNKKYRDGLVSLTS